MRLARARLGLGFAGMRLALLLRGLGATLAGGAANVGTIRASALPRFLTSLWHVSVQRIQPIAIYVWREKIRLKIFNCLMRIFCLQSKQKIREANKSLQR